jgi:hypothetical protein
LYRTFINLEGRIGERAKLPGSPASKSSDVLSRHSKSPSLGFKGDFRQWEDLLRLANNGSLFRLSYIKDRPVVHRTGAAPPSRIKQVDPRTGRSRPLCDTAANSGERGVCVTFPAGVDLVWHRSVLVCAGQLVRIVTV